MTGDSARLPVAGIRVRSVAWPAQAGSMPPQMGEHCAEVLGELLGKSDEETDKLVKDRVTDVLAERRTRAGSPESPAVLDPTTGRPTKPVSDPRG
jgi:hypothetical protein